MNGPIRIAVAHESRVVREGVASLLVQRGEIVVGSAEPGVEIASVVEATKSDVVLLHVGSSESALDEVLSVVRSVQRGETVCSPWIAARLFQRLAELSTEGITNDTGATTAITPREEEVLFLLAHGLANKQIAEHLHAELPTVKNHVHNLLEKLGVHRREDAVRAALERGLLRGLKEQGPFEV